MSTHATESFLRQLRRIVLFGTGAGPTDASLLGRFIDKRDEDAFEGLIRRHGPMVLGVCRRLLLDPQDAEDAFQATFLVLVRKAASVRPRDMVGNWLYGVAHQTAIRVRAFNAKKRTREQQMLILPEPRAAPSSAHEELRGWLDHALSQLPDKYRAAVVACDLEGKTRDEAARELGWPIGSLSSRLARGRALLAKRLAKHGPALSVGVLAAELSQSTASTCVPPAVMLDTIKAANLFAAGQTATTGVLSAKVVAVAEGMIRIMNLTKWATTTFVVFMLAGLGTGLGVGGYQLVQGGSAFPQGTVVRADEAPVAQAKSVKSAAQKTDKDRIVGVWRVRGYEADGNDISPDAQLAFVRFTFTNDGKCLNTTFNSTFTESKIQSMDYELVGPGKIDLRTGAKVKSSIYRFDGDNRLTICGAMGDSEVRPTEFVTDKGDQRAIFYLVRAKPGEEKPSQEDLDKSKAAVGQLKKNMAVPKSALARAVNANNLKEIALAFHFDHDKQRSLLANAIYSADGKTPLLSWRVAILSSLGHKNLYDQFKLDEPWDSEHNKKLIPQMPNVYASPIAEKGELGKTFYQVVTGPETLFNGAKTIPLTKILDGTVNTLLVIEAKDLVPWTKPADIVLPQDKDEKIAIGQLFPEGFHVSMCDAQVLFLSATTPAATLRALVTPKGGEVIDVDRLKATPKD